MTIRVGGVKARSVTAQSSTQSALHAAVLLPNHHEPLTSHERDASQRTSLCAARQQPDAAFAVGRTDRGPVRAAAGRPGLDADASGIACGSVSLGMCSRQRKMSADMGVAVARFMSVATRLNPDAAAHEEGR